MNLMNEIRKSGPSVAIREGQAAAITEVLGPPVYYICVREPCFTYVFVHKVNCSTTLGPLTVQVRGNIHLLRG